MPQIQAFAVTDADKNAADKKRFVALNTHRPDDWMGASDHSSSNTRGSFSRGGAAGPHSPKKKVLTLAEARDKIAHLASNGGSENHTTKHIGSGSSSHHMPAAPVMEDDEDDDDVVEYYSADEDETEFHHDEEEEDLVAPVVAAPAQAKPAKPFAKPTPRSEPSAANSNDAKKPDKRISAFELQMEGMANKDAQNVELVNPSAKFKHSQAPDGYDDEGRNPLTMASDIDLDALEEAPRSKVDPTARPRAMRGNSFGGTDHVFGDEAALRRGEKKPKGIEKHLQEKTKEPESEYSKPIAVDESSRPDYAQRPGSVRGTSNIDGDKLAKAASPLAGKKSSVVSRAETAIPGMISNKSGLEHTAATAKLDAKTPAKRISAFELQLEGMANKDTQNIELVNPLAKPKHSQAPEGYKYGGSPMLMAGDLDLDAMQEAPRAPRSKMDPTARPRAMRGNSFGGTDHVFGNETAPRRGDKKSNAIEKHVQEKLEEPEPEFSQPVVVDESARPDYAQRPGGLRGKSNIDGDKLATAVASPSNGSKKSLDPFKAGAAAMAGEIGQEQPVGAPSKADAKVPAKRISVFELQMEGMANKDDENVERVNPNAKAKHSQAPEGYEDERINTLYHSDNIDLDTLQEAPRAGRSMLDPTSRPRAMRGNSFGGTDHVFGDTAAPRRGEKKPKGIEKHLQEKAEEPASEFSKPIVVDESARPDYAQRPGVVRGKSGIDEEKLHGVVSSIRTGGKKKSLAVSGKDADDQGDAFLNDRPAPPQHTDSNAFLPDVQRQSGFGVMLRGTKKGEKLLAGEEIAHRVGGIRIVDDDE